MLYGANVWDPVLITAQIVSVQCMFYIVLGLLQAVIIGPRFGHLTIAYIFNYQTMHLGNHIGRLVVLTHAVNSIAAATHLMWIVERAKKCLDFASTCYIWHLIFSACYGGFPKTLTWWMVNLGGFIVTALVGEWLCVRRELQDIPLVSRVGNPARKGSGIVMPVPTEDPDALPPRPRMRAGVMQQRPAAAAAAAGAGGGGGGAGGAVQLSVLRDSATGGSGGGGGAGGSAAAAGSGARDSVTGGPSRALSTTAQRQAIKVLSRTASGANLPAIGRAEDSV